MSLRMIDHPVILIPFLLLTVSFLIDGKIGWVLMGLSFWLVLYISFTSDVKIEGRRIVIRIGRPLPLAKKTISLDEIVEVVELPSAYGIRLIEQFQRPWIPLGTLATGIFIGVLLILRGEFYGILWIYISVVSSLDYVFRPREKKTRIIASVVISLVSALAFLYINHPEFTLSVIFYGFFDALFANESYGQNSVVIKTESERIVLLGSPTSKEKFLEELKSILIGGPNVQTA